MAQRARCSALKSIDTHGLIQTYRHTNTDAAAFLMTILDGHIAPVHAG